MWILKVKVNSEKQLMGKLAIKNQIHLSGYPLSYYIENDKLHLIQCGLMIGEEDNKKQFLKELKKAKEVTNIEQNKDFLILTTIQPKFTQVFWNPKIIHPNPILINYNEKKHYWTFASFDKNILTDLSKIAKEELGAKLISLKDEKIDTISIVKPMPKLTEKQIKALEIALTNGYYNYPKKSNMEELAKIMGISYSTYQFHLKKAEGKIMPNFYENLK